jgi:hypothetical protein
MLLLIRVPCEIYLGSIRVGDKLKYVTVAPRFKYSCLRIQVAWQSSVQTEECSAIVSSTINFEDYGGLSIFSTCSIIRW